MCVWAEEMRREIMWNENSGCYWLRRRLLCQNPTKKSQVLVSLSRWMESGGSHREDKKVKVKIALKWNTIALKKKKTARSPQRSFISREKSDVRFTDNSYYSPPQWPMMSRVVKLSRFSRAMLQVAARNPDWQPGCSSWVTSFWLY